MTTTTYDPLKDGISRIELVDRMGDDLRVVNSARVSMGKHSEVLTDKDLKLLKYLRTHGHFTPFTHPQVTFRIKMPIFVARQWFKHQIGFTRNETSRRYVEDSPELYMPEGLRLRAPHVKQGSLDEARRTPFMAWMHGAYSKAVYSLLLKLGIAPEEARMFLPQSMYTEFFETGSLAAYARLCNLRLDEHAQSQTRKYAEAISNEMKQLFPISWAALVEEN